MTGDESQLDELFRNYRAACPEVEPSVHFARGVWQKIETRHSFWFVFQRGAQTVMTASAALCVLLLMLNLFSSTQSRAGEPTYVDALMAEHTAEKTYYTEAIRGTPAGEEDQPTIHR